MVEDALSPKPVTVEPSINGKLFLLFGPLLLKRVSFLGKLTRTNIYFFSRTYTTKYCTFLYTCTNRRSIRRLYTRSFKCWYKRDKSVRRASKSSRREKYTERHSDVEWSINQTPWEVRGAIICQAGNHIIARIHFYLRHKNWCWFTLLGRKRYIYYTVT